MVKVYAVALVVGVTGLLVVIFGGSLAHNLNRPEQDPGDRLGAPGKMIIGGVVGFGMGGMSAEFSPLELGWQVSFLVALLAAGLSALWVRYAVARG